MENVLKHVFWSYRFQEEEYLHGLIAVKMDNDRDWLEVIALAGHAMPANLLLPVLDAALPSGWVDAAEARHQSRVYPWRIYRRDGMSGCSDYNLYSLQNVEFINQPRVAKLHVSMYGKLNEGLRCWLGDLPPLLAALVQDYPPPPTDKYCFRVYEPVLRDGYKDPGHDSGLKAALDSLKAMEVMAK